MEPGKKEIAAYGRSKVRFARQPPRTPKTTISPHVEFAERIGDYVLIDISLHRATDYRKPRASLVRVAERSAFKAS
jgi:hypothetical protein